MRDGMSFPKIAVLCVTHGRPALVAKCLQSCAAQTYPNVEVVVVANPADAETENAIQGAAAGARIVRTHRNIGFFPALNLALANTDAPYVMIVDDDAWFLSDDALERLMAELRRMPELGAVTCNLEGPSETPISGGDRFIRAFTTGFTLMPRKAVTEWVGYFPDLFFRSAGEMFLCTSLWEQGRPVKRIEGVRMYHALTPQGRSSRDWLFHGLRSQLLCAVMREPALWLAPVMASKFARSLVFYARRRAMLIWLHAWLSFVFHVPQALRQRAPISARTRRLLQRLDSTVVRDLDQCPEWAARPPASAGLMRSESA
jgi:GT2 family glycosyltransferase